MNIHWWQDLPGTNPRALWCSGQWLVMQASIRGSSSPGNKWAHTLGAAWLPLTSTMTSASLNTENVILSLTFSFLYGTFRALRCALDYITAGYHKDRDQVQMHNGPYSKEIYKSIRPSVWELQKGHCKIKMQPTQFCLKPQNSDYFVSDSNSEIIVRMLRTKSQLWKQKRQSPKNNFQQP